MLAGRADVSGVAGASRTCRLSVSLWPDLGLGLQGEEAAQWEAGGHSCQAALLVWVSRRGRLSHRIASTSPGWKSLNTNYCVPLELLEWNETPEP